MDETDEADKMIVIYTTFPTESDARAAGLELVEARLAACVNILPGMTSIYRWEGAVETASEAVMLVKTRQAIESEVLDAIARRHPYSVPALIVYRPKSVATSYWNWLCEQTRPS